MLGGRSSAARGISLVPPRKPIPSHERREVSIRSLEPRAASNQAANAFANCRLQMYLRESSVAARTAPQLYSEFDDDWGIARCH